ncbi:GWxTD domain-containing protein [Pontibacter ruber]|uniref:GWxTD domain-containing protein n=1 Tax=Pontibacter ruber TaxID=1343895 RepID=A0ABW5CYG3_9BACT|nr:GWxTD domain-containing protein [Pontibacter ruber]
MKHSTTLVPLLALLLMLTACGGGDVPTAAISPQGQRPSVTRPVSPVVTMQHDFYTYNDSLHLFLRFEDASQVMDLQQTTQQLEYSVRSGSRERDALLVTDTLMVTGQKTAEGDGGVYFSFAVPSQLIAAPNTLHVRLWQKLAGQERVATLHSLTLKPEMLQKKYLMVQAGSGKPLFRNYANTSERLLLQQYGEAKPVRFQLLESPFTPALPPMSVKQEAPPKGIQVIDTLQFEPADTIKLEQPGLYLLASDYKGSGGLLVQPGAFPLVSTAQELLQPLIYLTTSTEREALFRTNNPKAAVDGFWLKVAGDKSTARDLIRTYYRRVEHANRLYTSHKAGWTTDRGMIYIVYGRPSDISRVGATETWIYRESESSPYVKFVFNKKENTFTENHYELIRHRDYEESWYSTVAQWRAGVTEM